MTSEARRTDVLKALRGGRESLDQLIVVLYDELRDIAHRHRAARGDVETLATTALVHEAYLKLVQPAAHDLHGRVHFFALAAKAMRQIVIDHARARIAGKRGGAHLQLVELDEAVDVADGELGPDELLRLDRALTHLGEDEPRLADLVELRFFAGLEIADIATLQNVSTRTLNRDWRRARAMLHAALYPDV